LFEFKQHYDKVVVTSDNLYRDASWAESVDSPVFASGAIGTVFTTDVMSIAMENLANVGNGGTLDVDNQPSAVSAIASFAEFVKTALSVKLDIDPTELRLGRERVKTSACLTERIFLADALENGAGYVRHASDPAVFEQFLLGQYEVLKEKWEDHHHAAVCDIACPDCLRNYGNRWEHKHLDWRLALDMAELCLGLELDERRSLSGAPRTAEMMQSALMNAGESATVDQMAGLYTVSIPGASAILGHPLWHQREALTADPMVEAKYELESKFGQRHKIFFTDVRDVASRPNHWIVSLLEND